MVHTTLVPNLLRKATRSMTIKISAKKNGTTTGSTKSLSITPKASPTSTPDQCIINVSLHKSTCQKYWYCQTRWKEYCEKRCSLKCHKFDRKLLCQRKHLWIFKNNFFYNSSGRLLLKCGHCNNEARDIVVESWMQCLLLRLKSQSAREASHHPAFMAIWLTIATLISLIYLIDEFFFWFLV